MGDEPRRSGRATKGQHKNASASPAPQPKAKSQPPKKSVEPTPKAEEEEEEEEEEEGGYDDEEEKIRCICGNDDPKDKRAFIGCEACEVWQHNICMGEPDDEDEVPEHYFCEECRPEEHRETLQAMERGERIWEVRNKIWANEKKAGRGRKGKNVKPGWLKKDVPDVLEDAEGVVEEEQEQQQVVEAEGAAGNKRKRGEEVQDEPAPEEVKEEEKPTRSSRQDKRRKSTMDDTPAAISDDPETALVDISKLPGDRRKIAEALSRIISEDLQHRAKSGEHSIPSGETAKSLAEHHASRIEYAMKMNHEGPGNPQYMAQFRALNANLKKNKVLISRLLDGSLTADELSTMGSKDMASEELQKERRAMKEQLDRQAVAIQEAEGPKYRRTHKGDELIEDENAAQRASAGGGEVKPVRERTSVAEDEGAGSPTAGDAGPPMQMEAPPLKVETRQPSSAGVGPERRSSSQQFDMNSIWARTAQSPTATAPRPMQMPPRRRSSAPRNDQVDGGGGSGTKDDADVDRMLQDDYETYSPPDYSGEDALVWRGKLIQSADGASPTVNARFVAGRDLTPTVQWRDLLPPRLSIDGRLAISKAEEYLCSLQWSQSSDVSVLQLLPYDDAEGFDAVFSYFKQRERYAVVHKDKPPLVKDLYIIPVEAGAEVPEHVGMLEFNRLGEKVGEKCLLASFIVSRAVGTPPALPQQALPEEAQKAANGGGQQSGLPQHLRAAAAAAASGPAGSPLNASGATFSPTHNDNGGATQLHQGNTLPPNPYAQTPPYPLQATPPTGTHAPQAQHPNPLVNEILGSLQYAPTAQQVVHADPNIAREKLEHLRRIMEQDPRTRTDVQALAGRLFEGS